MFQGDFCWALIQNSGQGGAGGGTYQQDMTNYLSTRWSQGFNQTYCTLIGNSALGGRDDGSTWDGTLPFTGGVVGALNNTYWNRVDYLVTTAASQGMTVMLNAAPTEGFNTGCPFNTATTGQCTNYGAALAARYGSATNIWWAFGDDYFSTYDTQYTAILNALRAGGDTHPCTIENFVETDSRYYPYDGTTLPWGLANATVNQVYTYNTWYSGVEYAYTEPSPICVALLDGFWDFNGTDFMRNESWWALSSGSRGHHYGNPGTISYTQAGFIADLATDSDAVLQGTYWSIFRNLGHWWKLVPDTSSRLVTAGRGTHIAPMIYTGGFYNGGNTYVSASLAADGTLAVIYTPAANTQTITVNGSLMNPGYTASWVDPASGAKTNAGISSTYTNSTLNSVGQHDWVLALQAPAAASVTTQTVSNMRLM